MKKLFILSAFMLAAAPLIFAKQVLPDVYTEIIYNYTTNPKDTARGMRKLHRFISKPVLLLDNRGFVLVKTKDYEDLLKSYENSKKDADEGKISSVSPKINLILPNQLHDYYFMNGEECKDIGEGFCIFKADFSAEISENAKALVYPKIFTDKNDAGVFKDTFQYKPPKHDAKMETLKSGMDKYFKELPGDGSLLPDAQNAAAKTN
ncbi:MAG: hypothetical protein FWF35_02070 [Elusimicrobia bacterium]|nr:hypothetical protein [Elusimicrobiota bacterium]